MCGTGGLGTAADYCQVTNVENVIGGNGVNTITGDANDNRLEGGVGDDVIVGGGGNDILAPAWQQHRHLRRVGELDPDLGAHRRRHRHHRPLPPTGRLGDDLK